MNFYSLVFAFLMTFHFGSAHGMATACRSVYAEPKAQFDYQQTLSVWYAPIAMDGEKWIQRDLITGRKRIEIFQPVNGVPRRLGNIELDPNAQDHDRTYYARVSLNRATDDLQAVLFPLQSTARLTAMIDQTVELTWQTYLKAGTVSEPEIAEFKKTEGELAPERKINFVTTSQDGRVLTVMRVYDGSPYPYSYFGDFPKYFEKVSGDPRLPIERRYPHLQLRSESPYVFEAGRLAKTDEFVDGLEYQFYNLGAYLKQKFGYRGVALPDFAKSGRIYIEITARHLKHYLRPREKGGMGFLLFAGAVDGRAMVPMPSDTTFESLKIRRDDHQSKFVLYLPVVNFISNFLTPVRLGRPDEL